MPNLNRLFFAHFLRENDAVQNADLKDKLTAIYGSEPHTFEKLEEDFDICKTQLLTLLDYIEQLNPNTLQLFAVYKQRVSELTKESAPPDIKITLKAAKEAIEKSLEAIISKNKQIDKTALNSLTTGLCYAGAYANIEQALGYFNGATSLSAMIHYSKKSIILDLAAAFLHEHQMVEHVGNEVHMANSLFNFVAEKYGLASQEDLFAPTYEIDVLTVFEAYVQYHLTIPALIKKIESSLPPLKETITQMADFQSLAEFFQILGYKSPGWDQYKQLYNDEDIDDVPTYVRKPYGELLLAGVMVQSLTKAGYIDFADLTIGDQNLIDTTEYIFAAKDGVIEFLSDDNLLMLLHSPERSIEAWRLINQMSPEAIVKVYREEGQFEEIRDFCFRLLMMQPQLPTDVFKQLYSAALDSGELSKLRELAHYSFAVNEPIPFDDYEELIGVLSQDEIYHYLMRAITHDIPSHIHALSFFQPLPLTPMQIIHLACRSNALNVIRMLGQLGFDFNTRDNLGYTPACVAVQNQNRELLLALHACGADLQTPVATSNNGTPHQGRSPIHIAATLGDTAMLETLHDLGADLYSADRNGDSAASIAINNNDIAVLEKLHELGVDLNKKGTAGFPHFSMFARILSTSPLELAIRTGNTAMIRALKILDVDLDALDGSEDTPMCLAIYRNQLPVLKILHELGADYTKRSKNGLSPMDLSVQNGYLAGIKFLNQSGIDINKADQNGVTPLHIAAEHGRADSIRTLKTLKADFNCANNSGQTPLFIAAQKGHAKALKWLLKYKADVNIADNQGHTPLYTAALHGQTEAFNVLMDNEPDLQLVHQNMSNLLSLNSKSKDKKMFYRLLDMNSNLENITIADWTQILTSLNNIEMEEVLRILITNDNTSVFKKLVELPHVSKLGVLHYLVFYAAQYAQSESIIESLHQSGISIDSYNGNGKSPVHLAAEAGNTVVLRQLIALNVELEGETQDNETPAFIAARMGHDSIIRLLLEQNKADTPVTIEISSLRSMVRKMDVQIIERAEQKISVVTGGDITLSPKDIAYIMGHEHIITLIDSYQTAPQTPPYRFGFFVPHAPVSPGSRNRSISEDENTSPTVSPSKANSKKRPNTVEILSPRENKKNYEPSDQIIEPRSFI